MTAPGPARMDGDAGSSALTLAIVAPAVFALVFLGAQVAMVGAAHHVALAAAQEGVRVARARGATPQQGQAAAIRFAGHEPVLLSPSAQVSGTTTLVVQVRGQAPSLLPGIQRPIFAEARGARERFTVPTGRQP